MSSPPYRFFNALLAGALVSLLAMMLKGFLIGIDQADGDWGWLAVPVDTVCAPALLIADALALRTGDYDKLIVLPWAMWGLLIGTAAGFYERD